MDPDVARAHRRRARGRAAARVPERGRAPGRRVAADRPRGRARADELPALGGQPARAAPRRGPARRRGAGRWRATPPALRPGEPLPSGGPPRLLAAGIGAVAVVVAVIVVADAL